MKTWQNKKNIYEWVSADSGYDVTNRPLQAYQ